MIGRGQNSSLLGHVLGLLFCLQLKHFQLSIFNNVAFWNSMSCMVPGIEFAGRTVSNVLGVSIDGNIQDYSFLP